MRKLLAALAAGVLIGGCVKMDTTPPKDLPGYVKYYPGSQQMMTMNMGAMESVVIKTTAAPDDVIQFYRTQAASDGLAETAAPNQPAASGAQKQVAFADAATGKMLVVVAQQQQGQTVVSLIYKPAPKASS